MLGLEIICDVNSHHIHISQNYYIQDIAAKFNMLNSKLTQSPKPLGIDVTALTDSNPDKEEMRNVPYRKLIGSLMFATTVSRPDIAYSVNKLAQDIANPSRMHWTLAKRIVQFLYHTRNWSLKLGGKSPLLYAYSDADFAGDTGDRKSTGGHAVFLGDGAVSWSEETEHGSSVIDRIGVYITLRNNS